VNLFRWFVLTISFFSFVNAEYPCVTNHKKNRMAFPCYIEDFREGSGSWEIHLNVLGQAVVRNLEEMASLSPKERKSMQKSLKHALKKQMVCELVEGLKERGQVSLLKCPAKSKKALRLFMNNPNQTENRLKAPVKFIQIFGERCSGTNFLEKLIRSNLHIPIRFPLGWKHFPISYEELVASEYLEQEEKVLIICIVRNLNDWLRSLHSTPHHAWAMRRYSFSGFLRAPWQTAEPRDRSKDGGLLKNVLALRAFKMKEFLRHKQHFSNFYFINYEVLKAYPAEVLADIASRYDLDCSPLFHDVKIYKGYRGQQNYRPKAYQPISQEDADYIKDNADLEIEKVAGYL